MPIRTPFLLSFLTCLPVFAQQLTLENALSRPILAANQPLVEVQVYTASRVKSMPLVSSAQQWTQMKERLRQRVLNEVVLRGEGCKWADARTRVEWLDVLPGRAYRIKRLRYEVIPGLWIPALLDEPEKLAGKVPVILNTNGHEGTGVANDYIQIRCVNLAKKEALALNFEWLGMGQLKMDGFRHTRSNQLDLVGTSGVALHYLSQKRGLDILLAHPNLDCKLAKGVNSGVKYLVFGMRPNPDIGRIDPEMPKALGLELQLIDDEHVADAKVQPSHGTGRCTCSPRQPRNCLHFPSSSGTPPASW
jgi:hypothetical protein